MPSSKDAKITIKKNHIIRAVIALAVVAAAVVLILTVLLPSLGSGVLSVKVQAGKMECKTAIPLIDYHGNPKHEMKIINGTVQAMAASPYVDFILVESTSGLRYTFKATFQEVGRRDRATGAETILGIEGTYRYCFIAAETTPPGTYDVKARVTFYNSTSEDASPIAIVEIPYKLQVLPAAK